MSLLRGILARLRGGHDGLGPRGEREAGRHLKALGYRVLATNVRTRSGEIDLVAEAPDGRTIVIVEVKSGRGGAVRPEVHVDARKRRKLAVLATQFVRRQGLTNRPVRFDVVAVDFPPNRAPSIRHHPGAFEAH